MARLSISACPAEARPAVGLAAPVVRQGAEGAVHRPQRRRRAVLQLLRQPRRIVRAGMPHPTKCSTISTGLARANTRPGRCAPARDLFFIDTNFAWATQPEIIDGMTKLGLNANDLKYVIISHAHGDHDQGAAELQTKYGAKVVMGAADWDSTLQRPATAAGGVPKRDITVGPEGSKIHAGRHHRHDRAYARSHTGNLVLCFSSEGRRQDRDGRVFRRYSDRRFRHRRLAMG